MQTVVPPVHAPFFPLEVPEKWVLVLSIVGRVETEHGKPVVRQEQAGRLVMLTQSFEFKGAEFDARTKELVVKVKFEAPPKTGIYRYEIACKCNGYLGLDVASEVECVGSRALASAVARAKLTRTAHMQRRCAAQARGEGGGARAGRRCCRGGGGRGGPGRAAGRHGACMRRATPLARRRGECNAVAACVAGAVQRGSGLGRRGGGGGGGRGRGEGGVARMWAPGMPCLWRW